MKGRSELKHLLLIVMLSMAGIAGAQTTCTPTAPCVQLAIANTNPLPSATVLWTCMGTCTQTSLNTVIAQQTPTNLCPTVPSVWHCTQFSQTKTPQLYNDPEPWGALMNYSTQGTSVGGVAATSPLMTFQVPSAPPQQTSISGVPTMVKTGTAGPQ
jgi:hypothetical protein